MLKIAVCDDNESFLETLKKIISESAIPFEISEDPFYSKSNLSFLKESVKEAKEGKTHKMSLEQLNSLGADSDED